MAITYLKRGKSDAERNDDDARTRDVVEATLQDIESRGDAAVRDLSEKFDSYTPASFRLSVEEIDALMARVTPREMEDIRFAQENVRRFAQAQRDSMQDIEVEMQPGVILGHKNIPVQSVGCYVPGGKFPMVASAHMSWGAFKRWGQWPLAPKRLIQCTFSLVPATPLSQRPSASCSGASALIYLPGRPKRW